MALALFENPLFALFGDTAVSHIFEPAHTLVLFNQVEQALTRAVAAEGIISDAAQTKVLATLSAFVPRAEDLEAASRRDGLPVPGYVAALKAAVGPGFADAVHVGSTSQDIIDTALALALSDANTIILERLSALIAALNALEARFGDNALVARTRMQAALPITAGHRIATWRRPLERQKARLPLVRNGIERLQFGGPVGTREGWGAKADAVARRMAADLGLNVHGNAWHTERDFVAHYGSWLSATGAALGKIGQDVALMSQQGIGEAVVTGAGGSSAMPHKQNPVAAEALVSLAMFTATQLSALHHAAVAEQERSGVAWALEWMVLPQMVTATGAGLLLANDLARSIEHLGTPG